MEIKDDDNKYKFCPIFLRNFFDGIKESIVFKKLPRELYEEMFNELRDEQEKKKSEKSDLNGGK